MTNAKKLKQLPKGLQEFRASLGSTEWGPQLLPRLLDLPECGLHEDVKRYQKALKVVAATEEAATKARHAAMLIADSTFNKAVANWTVKELQNATGYDDE